MEKPIIIIDDDHDDLEVFQQTINDLNFKNEVISFNDPYKFLDFIRTSDKSFAFIMCDINMNTMDGLELKKLLHDDESLRMKCIPFIFWSTSKATPTIREAYSYNVQGYFVKPSTVHELKEMVSSIIKYWNFSQNPNS